MGAALRHREGSFTGAGGLEIHWQSWRAEGPAKAVVVISHGAGEHSGRYRHLVERIVPAGYPVYAHDHRGHGRSQGQRAVIDRMRNATADLDSFIARAREAEPKGPMILLGHSMGGCISLDYVLEDQSRLDALVLSAPAAKLEQASTAVRLTSRVLSALTPTLGVFGVDAELISNDPAEVEAYRSDPLVHQGKLPARTIAELAAAIETFEDRMGNLTLPLLGMHGSEDRLAPVEGSRMVNRLAGSADKTLKVYDGLRHEIFNERPADRERVIGDLLAWLDAGSARTSEREAPRWTCGALTGEGRYLLLARLRSYAVGPEPFVGLYGGRTAIGIARETHIRAAAAAVTRTRRAGGSHPVIGVQTSGSAVARAAALATAEEVEEVAVRSRQRAGGAADDDELAREAEPLDRAAVEAVARLVEGEGREQHRLGALQRLALGDRGAADLDQRRRQVQAALGQRRLDAAPVVRLRVAGDQRRAEEQPLGDPLAPLPGVAAGDGDHHLVVEQVEDLEVVVL